MSGLANENNLPNEVWENILAHLPITDLLKNKCLVSKQWNDIISRKGVSFDLNIKCLIFNGSLYLFLYVLPVYEMEEAVSLLQT